MFKPPTFNAKDYNEWKQYLDGEGYVVIHNVLSADDISSAFGYFLKDITTVSPKFNIADPLTFDINYTPMMFAKGMAVFNGLGNSDFMWNMRTHPNILSIYKQLFGTQELNSSMDGFSMFVSSDQKPGQWLHTDQNPNNSIYSIQGAYNFIEVNKNSAGLVVVPKSHIKYNPKVNHSKDWIVYDKFKTGYEDLEKEAVKLLIPANCFVLWNSRTIHANTGIVKPTRSKVKQFNRLTCYIAYLPKTTIPDNIKEKIFEERKSAYLNGESTSHWSNKCEIKKYPNRFEATYTKRGFGKINPTLNDKGEIPADRLKLL